MEIKRKFLVGALAVVVACPIALATANASTSNPGPATPAVTTEAPVTTDTPPGMATAPPEQGNGQQPPTPAMEPNQDKMVRKLQQEDLKKAGLPTGLPTTTDCAPPAGQTSGSYTCTVQIDDVKAEKGSTSRVDPSSVKDENPAPDGGVTTSGLRPLVSWPPSPGFIPTWCINAKPGSGWRGWRNSMCATQRVQLQLRTYSTQEPPKLVGTMDMHQYIYIQTEWNSSQYRVRFAMETYNVTGDLWKPGLMAMHPSLLCWASSGGSCTVSNDTTLDSPLNPFANYTWDQAVTVYPQRDKKQAIDAATWMSIYFYQLAPVTPPISSSISNVPVDPNWRSPYARCDNLTSPSGCIMRDITSYFLVDYNRPKSHEWAKHVWDTEIGKADHWGLAPEYENQPPGKWLSYLPDGPERTWNRNITCPKPTPAEKKLIEQGLSCDEYPFASTRQGGYFVGAARTHKRYINDKHNSSGGGLTTDFYRKNRIRDGNRFWVWVYAG